MGSYYEGMPDGIGAPAGGLVWVRRCNGTWWPGRILAPCGLPPGCPCPPPRCKGTPIQLLGRDNGTVTWYNLEKSMRVKPFRCGEYDECIERAKASAIISRKKASSSGKYVHRRDAILHALELELSLGMNNPSYSSLGTQPENVPGHGKKRRARKLTELEENTAQELSMSVVSFEHQDNRTTSYMRIINQERQKTPNDSEDEMKGIKRTRNLQELGLEILSKKKYNMQIHSKRPHHLALTGSTSLTESDTADGFCSSSPVSSSKDSSSLLKQKHSQGVQDYENFERKCIRRPRTNVCVSKDRVKVSSVCCGGDFAEQSSLQGARHNKLKALKACSKKSELSFVADDSPGYSGTSCEETLLHACETKVDGTHLEYGTDSTLPVARECIDNGRSLGLLSIPLVMGEKLAEDLSCPFESYTSRKLQSLEGEKHSNHANMLSQVNESPVETFSTSSATQVFHAPQRMYRTSEQHSDGQRKSTCLRSIENVGSDNFVEWDDKSNNFLFDGKEINPSAFSESPTSDGNGQVVKCRSISEVVGDVPLVHTRKLPFTNAIKLANAKGHATKAVNRIHNAQSRDEGESPVIHDAKAANRINNSKLRAKGESPTIDVIDVPQKLLQYNQSPCLTYTECQHFSPVGCMPVDSSLYDVKLNVQASYMGPHAPLVSLVSKFNSQAIVGNPVTVEVLEDGVTTLVTRKDCFSTGMNDWPPPPKVQHTTEPYLNSKRISAHSVDTSPLLKQKPRGKKRGFSTRKIRTLSSITFDRRDKEEKRKLVVGNIGGPSISCVPLRLVFSRLDEALSSSTWSMTRRII